MKIKILLSLVLLMVSAFNSNSFCQDSVGSKTNYGVRFNSYYDFEVNHDYNFKIFHLAPVFSIGYKNHSFYLGPQYSFVFQPTPIANEIYEKNSFGLNLGYRYYSNTLLKHTRLFGQFNYSFFQVKYREYQLGPPFETNKVKVIAENTISLGLDQNVLKYFHLCFGFGFGSYDGFFLMLNKFTLTTFLGIEYQFK